MSTQQESGGGHRMISLGFDDEPWPAGTHMCMIFDDEAERRMVIAKYLQSGLDANEQVSYFVDTASPEEMLRSLGDDGMSLPEEGDGGQFRVVRAEEAYCPDGTFDVDRMLENLAELHGRSIREGRVGARVTGEMSWSRRGLPGSENLVEYEARINILVRTVPTAAICQYDARLFDGETLYQILCVHPMMIVHGQVLRNPFYIEPEEFLAKLATGPRL